MSLGGLAARFVAYGVVGWIVENIVSDTPRQAAVFKGVPVPFLPVYAIGGTAIELTAPHIKELPLPARAGIYATGMSGIEYAGCQIDRHVFNNCAWDYSNQACAKPLEGCVDAPHAIAWGLGGLLVERITRP